MMKEVRAMMKKLTTIYCLMITPLFLITMPTSLLSEEVRYPIPCYEGKDLEKVREWEKTWVGKRIDSSNVDEVKELLPETIYSLTKNTEKWGESWFEIVPYCPYKMATGTIEATIKYSPKCSIGEKEELVGWVAGVPFPEPKSGIEVAWNFHCWTRGDTEISSAAAFVVDGRRGSDRHTAFNLWVTYFAGRCDVPPIPELIPNPKKIYRGFFAEFIKPSEMKGFLNLQVTYKDPLKPYDSWIWIAALRRVRRQSTEQRVDTVGGQDNCYDDNYNWDGAITRNNYKLLGRKEFLFSRHQDLKQLEHMEGDCVFDGVRRERIKMWILEVVNKDPGYIYNKSIWYVDPELWHITYADKYDKYGKLWKTMEHFQSVYKGYNEMDAAFFCGAPTIDHQREHATLGTVDNQLGKNIPITTYSISHLYRYGR